MCSLAQGIAYEARQEGILETKVSIVVNLIQSNLASKDDAFKCVEADDEVKEIVDKIIKENK